MSMRERVEEIVSEVVFDSSKGMFVVDAILQEIQPFVELSNNLVDGLDWALRIGQFPTGLDSLGEYKKLVEQAQQALDKVEGK